MKKILGIDDVSGVEISQGLLEKIGIGISECELCKEIHFIAKPTKRKNSKFLIDTHDPKLLEHLHILRRCYYEDSNADFPCQTPVLDCKR